MKKILLASYLITVLSLDGFSQKIGLDFNLGVVPVKTESGNLLFEYLDESPSQDYLISEVPIKEKSFGVYLGMDLDFISKSNVLFRLGVGGVLGKVKEFDLNFGVGYELELKEKYKLRPLAVFAYGSSWIKLGDVYQNDLFIEVNRTRFYSNSVEIDLNRKHFLFHPQLEFGIPLKDLSSEFIFNLGYRVPINIKSPNLTFSGEDINDEPVTASESINANNVFLSLNDNRFRSNLIGVNGLSFKLGVNIYFN